MVSDGINSPQYLISQYQDSTNLKTRVDLHSRFSLNYYGWSKWVFDQFRLKPQANILELGCGTGGLWSDNLTRVPEKCNVLLTDFSEGMLRQTRFRLAGDQRFKFQRVDAQTFPLPFLNSHFDMVVANHMLYHILDRQSLFSEIARILKPNGFLYTSTVGQRHLIEITDMLIEFDPTLSSWGTATGSFTLENGTTQLSPWFTNIRLNRYEDALAVTEVEPLINYIFSGWFELEEGRRESFRQFVECKFKSFNGVIHISKDSGIFEANCR